MRTVTILLLATLTALFIGCGGGGSSSDTKTEISAQLVDSPIAGVTYICQDGTSGLTDSEGMFTCNATPVRFRIGNLQLGIIDTIPSDNKIFPQDLLGLDRAAYGDPKLIALTQLFQSMDSDGDISETITVPSEMAEKFTNCYSEIEYFHLNSNSVIEDKLYEYAACAGVTPVSGADAIKNLQDYYNAHVSSSASSSSLSGGGVSSQSNSSQGQTSSTDNSQGSTSSSTAQAGNGTWSIDVDFQGRSYSHTWHWDNVKIASKADPVKTEWDATYPFPYLGNYGEKILLDTSFYNTDGAEGLIVSYFSSDYGVNGDAVFAKKGFCLDAEWINTIVTDQGDTSFACSNKAYTSSWDIINTSLNADQAAAYQAHQAFTFHDTGRWINDGGSSSLTITFTPSH